MLRYLRLYGCFVRFSFSRALQFRLDFFFRVVMDCMFYAMHLGFFAILYGHVAELGGFDRHQTMIFCAGFFFVDALHMTIFSNNMWHLPSLINQGDLDYYLVRPAATLFFVSLQEFAANSFLNLLITAGILVWAIATYPSPLTTIEIAGFVVLLVLGTLLYWSLYMLCILPVFWLHSAQGIKNFFFSIEQFTQRPHRIYTGWAGRLLRSVLPFAMVASYQSYLLLRGWDWRALAELIGVVAIFFALVLGVWSRGLRVYASASS
ncbi:MAG: ABC transporter permease [Planctomycetota bacterium]